MTKVLQIQRTTLISPQKKSEKWQKHNIYFTAHNHNTTTCRTAKLMNKAKSTVKFMT